MALQSAYQQFLAAPSPDLLASDASLHYITTLITLSGAPAIVKHLKNQTHELKKKQEKFLDVVEGPTSLAVEVDTTIEFVAGGGSYLPSLDDNFLVDRVVTIPVIHIVNFDASGKIQQIRQSWDQGSLLKLIDVIGKTGRNWPIRDGKDQIKLIVSSVKLSGKPGSDGEGQSDIIRSRGNSTNVTRDPHASLSLFAPRSTEIPDSLPAVVAPRASAKPPPRDYHELFVTAETQNGAASDIRSPSPLKENTVAPKAGAGKNFAPSRLFDNDENSPIRPSPDKTVSNERFYRPNPAKFQHFTLGDDHEDENSTSQHIPLREKTNKHQSQWNFDDFNTPQKIVPSKVLRTNDVRHWGTSDDEVVDSPIKMKKVDKPRKDAETHFEFIDDGTPEGARRLIGRPRGTGQNTGMGLYKNNLYDDESGGQFGGDEKPLSTTANTKVRSKDFDPHFAMTDDSPAGKPVVDRVSQDRAKAVKMMDANWAAYDKSPGQKENVPASPSRPTASTNKAPLSESSNRNENKGISIAGDGMGSKKAASQRTDESKGISIAGDGMGGKKGSGRQWGFGDESDGEEVGGINRPGKYRTGKTASKPQPSNDFWDF